MGIGSDGGLCRVRTHVRAGSPSRVGTGLKSEIAAFAEPLACAVNGMNKIRANPGDSVVIIGGGPIALMFVKLMKASGASPIIVSEPVELRRRIAKTCGADYVVNPLAEDLKAIVQDVTGIGADIAIEVVGSQVAAALDVIRKGGKVLLFGINMKAAPTISPSSITVKGSADPGNLAGQRLVPARRRDTGKGNHRPRAPDHSRFPLAKTAEAIEVLRKGEGVKVFINPRG